MKLYFKTARVLPWIAIAALAACGESASPPAIADWHTNSLEAKQLALQTHHLLLVAFMGSDWSEPCQEIRKDVLDTQAFKDFADANLVLVMADFSRSNPPPPDLAKQYSDMAKGGQVTQLPVFMLVDPSNGMAFPRNGVTNYNSASGPDGFINLLQNDILQYQQSLQQSVPAPVGTPVAQSPASQPPSSTPAFSQPAATRPSSLPGLPSFPSSLPSPDELMRRNQPSPPPSP